MKAVSGCYSCMSECIVFVSIQQACHVMSCHVTSCVVFAVDWYISTNPMTCRPPLSISRPLTYRNFQVVNRPFIVRLADEVRPHYLQHIDMCRMYRRSTSVVIWVPWKHLGTTFRLLLGQHNGPSFQIRRHSNERYHCYSHLQNGRWSNLSSSNLKMFNFLVSVEKWLL
jgi:hypothetical protein